MPPRARQAARGVKPPAREPGKKKLLVLSGPNLQLLGTREPATYGTDTLAMIHARLDEVAQARGARVDCRQSNHEGELLDWLGDARASGFEGVLLNSGAL